MKSKIAISLLAFAFADVHPDRAAMIKEIESTPGVLWKASPNLFASEAPGAFKTLLGVVGNQSKAIEDALQMGEVVEDVCFNGGGFFSNGCNGGQITSPWSFMKAGGMFSTHGAVSGGQYQGTGAFGKGLCSDFSMPHCHHHGPQGNDPYPAEGQPGCPSQSSPAGPTACDESAQAPHNSFNKDKYSFEGKTVTARGVEAIQQAIMAGGPMEVAFDVYTDFENYAGGIYHHVSGSMAGGHAVKVVGWGQEGGVNYWKIANSWNPYWGENGYFRIRFGEGGIDSEAIASDPSATWKWAGDAEVVV